MSVDAHIMIDAVAREKLEMQILLSGFNDIKGLVVILGRSQNREKCLGVSFMLLAQLLSSI